MSAENPNQLLNQAAGLVRQRQFDQAIAVLGKLLGTYPEHDQAHLLLGIAHHYKGETLASRACFERSLAINRLCSAAPRVAMKIESSPDSVPTISGQPVRSR